MKQIKSLEDIYSSVEEKYIEYFKSKPSLKDDVHLKIKECIQVTIYKTKDKKEAGVSYEQYSYVTNKQLPGKIEKDFKEALNSYVDANPQ